MKKKRNIDANLLLATLIKRREIAMRMSEKLSDKKHVLTWTTRAAQLGEIVILVDSLARSK